MYGGEKCCEWITARWPISHGESCVESGWALREAAPNTPVRTTSSLADVSMWTGVGVVETPFRDRRATGVGWLGTGTFDSATRILFQSDTARLSYSNSRKVDDRLRRCV